MRIHFSKVGFSWKRGRTCSWEFDIFNGGWKLSEVDHFHHQIDCYFQFPDLLANHGRSTAPVYFSMKLETPRSFCIDTHSSRSDSRPINGFRYRLASAQEKIALGSLHIHIYSVPLMLMFPCAFASVSVTYCHHSSSTGLPTGKAKGYFLCHKAHTIIDSLSLRWRQKACHRHAEFYRKAIQQFAGWFKGKQPIANTENVVKESRPSSVHKYRCAEGGFLVASDGWFFSFSLCVCVRIQ